MMQTCLLCGSTDLEITGIYIAPDGDTFAVYYVCGTCWEGLGPDAIGSLAEAALAGVGGTVN
jgi:hypothetical protein